MILNLFSCIMCFSIKQGNWTFEYTKLKARIELLQRNHRYVKSCLNILMPESMHPIKLTMNETHSMSYFVWMHIFRHYMGEDLDSLTLKEIQSLEQQLDTALKNIRSRKVCMHACSLILMFIYEICMHFWLLV